MPEFAVPCTVGIHKNISLQLYTLYIANINNHATTHEINMNYHSKQKLPPLATLIMHWLSTLLESTVLNHINSRRQVYCHLLVCGHYICTTSLGLPILHNTSCCHSSLKHCPVLHRHAYTRTHTHTCTHTPCYIATQLQSCYIAK